MNTINFREAVKLIHPDVCGRTLDNVGEKMNTIKLYRNDEQALYNFLKEWKIIDTKKTKEKPKFFKLESNTDYSNRIVFVNIVFGNYEIALRILKTSAKMVFFSENPSNRKRANMNKVIRSWEVYEI